MRAGSKVASPPFACSFCSVRRLLCRKAVDLSEGLSEAGVGSEMRPPWVAGRVTSKHQHKQQICSKDCVQGQGQFRYVTIITTSAERGSAMSPLCRIATNETAESRLQINDALCLVVVEGKEIPKRGRELRILVSESEQRATGGRFRNLTGPP